MLITSYERLAKIYAKTAGINLIVRGGGFCTDGKRIVIAEIPDKLNSKLKDPALAGLVHECNHIRHSWFPRNKKESEEKNLDPFQKKYKGLINNLEDVRILHLGRKEYPGMDSLQKSGLKFIKDSFLEEKIQDKKIPISALLGMCIQWKESNENSSFFPKTINQMAELTKDIWHNAQWTPYEEGHKESEIIVKRIVKRLKQQQKSVSEQKEKNVNGQNENNKKSKEKNKEDKGNKTKTNEKEENNEEGTEKGENEIEEISQKESDLQSPEEKGKKDYDGDNLEEDLENLFEENTENSSHIEPTGVMEIMTEIVEEVIKDFNKREGKHIPHPVAVALDVEEHINNPFRKEKMGGLDIEMYKKEFREAIEKIDKETEKLKAKALPLLMAEKRDSFIYEQKEGIIDGAQLYKLQKGNGNIYKQKVLGRKINTAVTILCDVSGSMSGRKISMLKSTLLVIGDTMFALKIPFEILSYTTTLRSHPNIIKIKEEYYKNSQAYPYNRLEPLLLTVIKGFNENYINIRTLIPLMHSQNNTPTNEALKWGCKRLIQRNENRKMLFILEDGHPGLEISDRSLLERDLIENVVQAEKSGIEIIGIGLLSNSVKDFYKNFIVIDKTTQISIKVYKALLKTLKTHSENRR